MDFSKFDKQVDIDALKNDVAEAEENGTGNYEDVPHGTYEVAVNKLELTESKKGDPMLTAWFKIVNGDHKNQMIFMNQVITRGFQIHIVKEMLRSLTDGEMEITFESYSQFDKLVMDAAEFIDERFEYALKYGENNKGYSTFEITEVFEVE